MQTRRKSTLSSFVWRLRFIAGRPPQVHRVCDMTLTSTWQCCANARQGQTEHCGHCLFDGCLGSAWKEPCTSGSRDTTHAPLHFHSAIMKFSFDTDATCANPRMSQVLNLWKTWCLMLPVWRIPAGHNLQATFRAIYTPSCFYNFATNRMCMFLTTLAH